MGRFLPVAILLFSVISAILWFNFRSMDLTQEKLEIQNATQAPPDDPTPPYPDLKAVPPKPELSSPESKPQEPEQIGRQTSPPIVPNPRQDLEIFSLNSHTKPAKATAVTEERAKKKINNFVSTSHDDENNENMKERISPKPDIQLSEDTTFQASTPHDTKRQAVESIYAEKKTHITEQKISAPHSTRIDSNTPMRKEMLKPPPIVKKSQKQLLIETAESITSLLSKDENSSQDKVRAENLKVLDAKPEEPLVSPRLSIDLMRYDSKTRTLLLAGDSQKIKEELAIVYNGKHAATITPGAQGQWTSEKHIEESGSIMIEISRSSYFNSGAPDPAAQVASIFIPQTNFTPIAKRTHDKSHSTTQEYTQAQEHTQSTLTQKLPKDEPQENSEPLLAILNTIDGQVLLKSDIRPALHGYGISRLSYDFFGNIHIEGKAPAYNAVWLYLNNALFDQVRSNKQGHWRSMPQRKRLNVGKYILRADFIDDAGNVIQRFEQKFTRQPTIWDTQGRVSIEIKRGDMLWTIASKAYGTGEKYTLIFEQNRKKIKDPNLIYPQQVFDLVRNE